MMHIILAVLIICALHYVGAADGVGLHRIPEGHVGVYYRGGALLDRVTWPGFRFKTPLITKHHAVQVTVQTDKVVDVPCGTSGGTVISFDKVEVVNQLHADAAHAIVKNYTVHYDRTWIYDKIHHEINQFCSQHTLQEVYIDKFDRLDEILKETLQRDIDIFAPGLTIIAIRVTKPRIPKEILLNYEKIESEKTRLKVAEQHQKLVEKEAETERKKAVIEADKEAMVAAIHLNRTLAEKVNEQRMAQIDNEMQLAKVKAESDAELYRATQEAEANRLRLTPELLQLETVRALANNTKIYFGENIPNIFLDNQMAGLSTSP
jgi:regulator of protease activity HflC (stomatin/prohibitin superfamily)